MDVATAALLVSVASFVWGAVKLNRDRYDQALREELAQAQRALQTATVDLKAAQATIEDQQRELGGLRDQMDTMSHEMQHAGERHQEEQELMRAQNVLLKEQNRRFRDENRLLRDALNRLGKGNSLPPPITDTIA